MYVCLKERRDLDGESDKGNRELSCKRGRPKKWCTESICVKRYEGSSEVRV